VTRDYFFEQKDIVDMFYKYKIAASNQRKVFALPGFDGADVTFDGLYTCTRALL